ncbi:MAG: glycoside hydrolase family 5 protein [Sphingobacteriaceae bacterium]|nr:MAG: glycoside hydrolase family 5 protein [Sphingobacteriaceae bacterium]
MKKTFYFQILFLLSCFFCQAQFVKTHGKLQVVGTQLQDEHGKPVILRGMSYGWHNFWPQYYNAGTVKWLHQDWDCTVLRAAMGVEPAKGYIQDPVKSKQLITNVVDAAIKEGIYVLIDFHSHNIRLKEAKLFFTEMARKYGKTPNVIYEIFNEPDTETWPQVKAYAEEIVATIRAIDPDNIILIGSPHWDQDVNLAADDPLRNVSNVMYTCHFYAATHKQSLRDRCDYALKKGLPIFISESAGMEASGDGPLNMPEWQAWIDWCESRKISWITWSVSDKDETCSVLKSGANPTGNWAASDLKESGTISRELLKKYNK